MYYLDAAQQILQQSDSPLHYEEITERALGGHLISPQGLTPAATMASRLYTDTKQEGSRFVRAGNGRFGLAAWKPKGIEAHAQEINQATRRHLAQLLQTMPPEKFEGLIGELLIRMGFEEDSVTITKYSGDGGIDVIGDYRAAGLTEVSAAVQVKRWKGNIQAPTITQLRGSLQVHQQGIIITTGDFSAGARKEANASNKTHIGLIGGEELLDLLIKYQVGVAERTLTVIGLDDEFWGELSEEEDAKGTSIGNTVKTPPEPCRKPGAAPEDGHLKPSGYTFLGKWYNVDSWRGILLGLCEVLAKMHGAGFAPIAFTVRGKSRQYVADLPEGMINPTPIPGTKLWVELNQSAASVRNVAVKLLEAFGYASDSLSISTKPQP